MDAKLAHEPLHSAPRHLRAFPVELFPDLVGAVGMKFSLFSRRSCLSSPASALLIPARFPQSRSTRRTQLNGRPLCKVGLLLLLDQPNGSILELIRVTRLLLFRVHDSILSKNRASENPGAIHFVSPIPV